MTEVCFVGDDDCDLKFELLSRETSREALSTYDLHEPFANAIAVSTVSLGAAVSLCNDLNWYVVRFVDDVIVHEPSVSEAEWLSRDLATAVRDDELDPAASDRFLKVYGVEYGHGADRPEPGESDGNESGGDESEAGPDAAAADQGGPGADDGADDPGPPSTTGGGSPLGGDGGSATAVPPRLVEPMFVTRTGDTIPEYDLREVEETLVVRVTEAEFGA